MRRRELIGVVAGSAVVGAGCLDGSDSEDDEAAQTEPETDPETPTPTEEPDSVSPSIMSRSYPEPRAVDLDAERDDGARLADYTAEVQNTGVGGEIGFTLVFMDEHQEAWDDDVHVVDDTVRYFNADERRDVSISAEPPEEYEYYGFRFWSAYFEVEVHNDGSTGRVEVLMMDGSEVIDDVELLVESGETTEAVFDSQYSELDIENVEFDVHEA